jgi:hypothetical protein
MMSQKDRRAFPCPQGNGKGAGLQLVVRLATPLADSEGRWRRLAAFLLSVKQEVHPEEPQHREDLEEGGSKSAPSNQA